MKKAGEKFGIVTVKKVLFTGRMENYFVNANRDASKKCNMSFMLRTGNNRSWTVDCGPDGSVVVKRVENHKFVEVAKGVGSIAFHNTALMIEFVNEAGERTRVWGDAVVNVKDHLFNVDIYTYTLDGDRNL
jgi:hypothetical protein